MLDLEYDLKSICRRNRDGSHMTQAQREQRLRMIARDLHGLGYRNLRASSLKPKHVNALIAEWQANIKRFHASERAWTDSCADRDNATLNRLWPGRRRLRSIVATQREASGALAYAKWRSAAAALPIRRKLTSVRG